VSDLSGVHSLSFTWNSLSDNNQLEKLYIYDILLCNLVTLIFVVCAIFFNWNLTSIWWGAANGNFKLGLCKLRCFPAVAIAWDRTSGLHVYPNLNSETVIVDSAPALWNSAHGSEKTTVLLLVQSTTTLACSYLYYSPFYLCRFCVSSFMIDFNLASFVSHYRLILTVLTRPATLSLLLLLQADFCFYTFLRWWVVIHILAWTLFHRDFTLYKMQREWIILQHISCSETWISVQCSTRNL